MIGEFLPGSGIVALYHLSDLTDSSGNGYDLVDYAPSFPAQFVDGILGKCATNPSDWTYLKYSPFDVLDLREPFSISLRYKPIRLPTNNSGWEICQIHWYQSSTVKRGIRIAHSNFYGGQKLQIEPSDDVVYTSWSPSTANSYLIDFTCDGSTAKLYLDGYVKISTPWGSLSPVLNQGTTSVLTILDSQHYYEDCEMVDEVAVFDYCRSPLEIYQWATNMKSSRGTMFRGMFGGMFRT
jgi:hypothetical protein